MNADDAQLAAGLARTAGELLLALRAGGVLDGRALGDAGDQVANALIVRALAEHRPGDGMLSEESADDLSRLERARVWIVDPLDGTREYSEGREDWAVHVALCVDGEATAASAVAIPARGQLFSGGERLALGAASPGDGPLREAPRREAPRREGPLRIAVSRSRPPALAQDVAAALGAELLPLGSAGFKAAAVLSGEADAYLHAGGQHEWDSAAPAGVALASGFHASRLDGSPLRYNRPDPSLPDLLICRRELASTLLDAIAGSPRSE
ncbi:MAG: 3'(2'),5'-bisphosphate nucleotidase CysQ [Solirubrobacteraceae bacterium]